MNNDKNDETRKAPRLKVVHVEAKRVFTQADYYELVNGLLDDGATTEDLEHMGFHTYEDWVRGITGGTDPWPVAFVSTDELNDVVQDLNDYHNKEDV